MNPAPGSRPRLGYQRHSCGSPQGIPAFQEGLPRVSCCASMGLVGAGGNTGSRGARAPLRPHTARVPQTTSLQCLILQREHHTSNSKRGSGCQSPTEGAGGIGGELGTHGGCAQPGCSCSQQQSAASSLYTHLLRRPSGDIKDDCNHCLSRNTIYLWPSSHCPVWINQKENKALWKKDY